MQKLACLVLFVLAVMAQAEDKKPQYDLSNGPALFETFISEHNRQYKDEADREAHYQAFLKSLKVINEANAADSGATFDINQFADYTPEQKRFMHGIKRN